MLKDLLLPATDAGVLAQVIGLAVATAAGAFAVRRSPDMLWLVAGVATMVMGFFGLRALH